jgi:Phosphodiester glycosidase
MMRCSAATIVMMATLVRVARAAPVETTTTPYPGITHIAWTDAAANQQVHFVVIDLSNASLTLRVTDEVDRGHTTSQIANLYGAQVAINGDLFAPGDYLPAGLTVGNAGPWLAGHDDDRQAVLRFGKVIGATDALIIVPESVVAPGDLPAYVTGAIGGRPMVVRAGQIPAAFDCGDGNAIACQRGPRTAVGLSADRRIMTLAVVDGWQAGAVGMTAAELAGLLVARGVRDALLLDGGSASTLFIGNQGGVVNHPSDGAERPVANHLVISSGPVITRSMYGVVRVNDILTGAKIAGVLLTLDDGRTATTDAVDSDYNFIDVPIRYACVDAFKVGYDPVHQCKQMIAGDPRTYNSIALFAVGTGPDAGVDAGIDAPGPIDARSDGRAGDGGADAGSGSGSSGGCCRTASDHQGGGGWPVAALAGFVVFAVGRSRRRQR